MISSNSIIFSLALAYCVPAINMLILKPAITLLRFPAANKVPIKQNLLKILVSTVWTGYRPG